MNYSQILLKDVLPTLIPIVTGILIYGLKVLLSELIGYLNKKHILMISQIQQQQLDDIIEKGVNYAEEYANSRLKIANSPISSQDKQTAAIGLACKLINDNPLIKNLTADDISKLVLAKLGSMKNNNCTVTKIVQ